MEGADEPQDVQTGYPNIPSGHVSVQLETVQFNWSTDTSKAYV